MLNNTTIQHPHGREGKLDAKSQLSQPRRWRRLATQPKPAMLYVYEHLHTRYFELPVTSNRRFRTFSYASYP